MRAVPWSPDGSDNAFDIQVGMERTSEDVPSQSGLRSVGSLVKGVLDADI